MDEGYRIDYGFGMKSDLNENSSRFENKHWGCIRISDC